MNTRINIYIHMHVPCYTLSNLTNSTNLLKYLFYICCMSLGVFISYNSFRGSLYELILPLVQLYVYIEYVNYIDRLVACKGYSDNPRISSVIY